MTEELKLPLSIDTRKFRSLVEYLTQDERKALVHHIDSHVLQAIEADRASRPEAESEMPIGRCVTYVPQRAKKGVFEITAWMPVDCDLPPHRSIVRDIPLYTRLVAGNAARDDARDAERYRWLRDPKTVLCGVIDEQESETYRFGEDLDQAIDAAIKASKQGGETP